MGETSATEAQIPPIVWRDRHEATRQTRRDRLTYTLLPSPIAESVARNSYRPAPAACDRLHTRSPSSPGPSPPGTECGPTQLSSIDRAVEIMYPLVSGVIRHIPETSVRYLMGVGKPEDLVESVASGIDLFDCVMPTRNARNGGLFTRTGMISIKNQEHKNIESPIDASSI